MKINTKMFGIKPFLVGACAAASVSALLCAQPAFAGYWKLTGTPTGGYTAGAWGSGLQITSGQSSLSFSDTGGLSNSPSIAGNFSYNGTATWVPSGGSDPAPTHITLAETGDTYGRVLYASLASTASASDGLGDAAVTTYTTGYPGNTLNVESTGTHSTTLPVSHGVLHFSRTFTNAAATGVIVEGGVSYSVSVS
jgi:hypothetical protein